MNLWEVSENQDREASGAARPDARRNSHIIRFSQIDGAGIVFYPRYFEMLTDSFPQQFAVPQSAGDDVTGIRISFRHPARLGERLKLHPQQQDVHQEKFSVVGKTAEAQCIEVQVGPQAPQRPDWIVDERAFVREAEIHDWMTGADSRLHLARCYELTATLMEEWFNVSLGYPFATLHAADGASVPTVSLESEIHDLPRSGEMVKLSLSVLRVGRSSLHMGMSVRRDDKLLVQTKQVVVFVRNSQSGLSSVSIPGPLAEKLLCQLVPHAA